MVSDGTLKEVEGGKGHKTEKLKKDNQITDVQAWERGDHSYK